MSALTIAIISVSGIVGLFFLIIGLMYFINSFGFYRRSNKRLKAQEQQTKTTKVRGGRR